ncbi:MAG: ubiquinone biosynthesis protein COQ9 [Rickettsiales bacterium]|jgi:ubiquinone biosynthesis protein COQ9
MSLIDSEKNKEKILKKFFEISSTFGCSEEVLQRSITESGFDSKLKDIFFENGLIDLFNFATDVLDRKTLKEAEGIDFSELGISGKIREFVKIRLHLIADNYDSFCQISFYLRHNPKNLSFILQKSYKFSDLVWYEIGDKSTDYNFYSKRILLSKIYLKTFSFFSKNNSVDKSLLYFDSQIQNVLKFSKVKSEIKEMIGVISQKNHDNNLTFTKEVFKKCFLKLPFIRLYDGR